MARHIPGPLYFDQHGTQGLPMIFLHSTPDDHRLWMYQTARFSSWFRTIAVDLAGYGRSGPAQNGLSVSDQADAAWEVVDQISAGKVIIHGNSMGSMVAMQMAHEQPARVPALILSGTGYLPTRDAMKVWAKRYAEEGIELRYKQCLDHFSPPAQQLPHVQYYARMACELNNPSTLGSIIAMNEALARDPEPELVLPRIDDADDHHQRHRRSQSRGGARTASTHSRLDLQGGAECRACGDAGNALALRRLLHRIPGEARPLAGRTAATGEISKK